MVSYYDDNSTHSCFTNSSYFSSAVLNTNFIVEEGFSKVESFVATIATAITTATKCCNDFIKTSFNL